MNIVLLGPGNVGRTFLAQLLTQSQIIKKQYGILPRVVGVYGSSTSYFSPKGIDRHRLQDIVNGKKSALSQLWSTRSLLADISSLSHPMITVDTTASDTTPVVLLHTLKRKGYVVLSNKKPLSDTLSIFRKLYAYRNRLFFETNVGAGLPIIETLRNLLETGDDIITIEGSFSGTLGYIFTLLSQDIAFSDAIQKASEQGYTEPDPRDDLSGIDVARKALILYRMIHKNKSLHDVAVEPLYPKDLQKATIPEFLTTVSKLDPLMAEKVRKAKKIGRTLRYVASITKTAIALKLLAVPMDSDLGTLSGPDNIVLFRTRAYEKNPLVIKGPGAGLAVTAQGVFADVLKIVRQITKGGRI